MGSVFMFPRLLIFSSRQRGVPRTAGTDASHVSSPLLDSSGSRFCRKEGVPNPHRCKNVNTHELLELRRCLLPPFMSRITRGAGEVSDTLSKIFCHCSSCLRLRDRGGVFGGKRAEQNDCRHAPLRSPLLKPWRSKPTQQRGLLK